MLFGTNCEIPLLISMVHHIKTMKQNKRREKRQHQKQETESKFNGKSREKEHTVRKSLFIDLCFVNWESFWNSFSHCYYSIDPHDRGMLSSTHSSIYRYCAQRFAWMAENLGWNWDHTASLMLGTLYSCADARQTITHQQLNFNFFAILGWHCPRGVERSEKKLCKSQIDLFELKF